MQVARLVGKGASLRAAGQVAGVSYSSIMRARKENDSPLNLLLADAGVATLVNYRELSEEAKRAATDFGYFRARYFARSTSPWAEEAAMKVVELLATPKKEYLVVNIGPGVGKSSFFTHDLPAWLIVRNRSIRQLIGSSTQRMANAYTGALRNTLERVTPVQANSELVDRGVAKDAESTLVKDFGRFKPIDAGLWRREEFIVEQPNGVSQNKEASVVAFGMDGTFLGGRFDNVIWDDLVTLETTRTAQSRENLIDWWEAEAETRLEPGGLLILQGQRIASDDLYRYVLDLADWVELDETVEAPKKYHHIVFKSHYEENCTKQHETDAPPYPQGCLLDPYRLPFRELMRVKLNKADRFQLTFQQEDVDTGSSLAQRAWFDGTPDSKGFTGPGCYDENRVIGIAPQGIRGFSVVTVDPSPTKFWAIIWWLYDPNTKLMHLIDLHRAQMDAPDFLDWSHAQGKFIGLLEEWRERAAAQGRPLTNLIMEANAAQRFMSQYDHFRRWQSQHRITLTPHQTFKNKSDPEYGVQTMSSLYRFGQIRLPGEVVSGSKKQVEMLVREACNYPSGATDDTVMSTWFLHWNAPRLFRRQSTAPYTYDVPSWLRTG